MIVLALSRNRVLTWFPCRCSVFTHKLYYRSFFYFRDFQNLSKEDMLKNNELVSWTIFNIYNAFSLYVFETVFGMKNIKHFSFSHYYWNCDRKWKPVSINVDKFFLSDIVIMPIFGNYQSLVKTKSIKRTRSLARCQRMTMIMRMMFYQQQC